MSYDDGVMTEIDSDDLPGLESEEDRDEWVEILMSQDEETVAANGGWCKALTVADEAGNMVARFVYPDGREEVLDLVIRRSIDVAVVGDRN